MDTAFVQHYPCDGCRIGKVNMTTRREKEGKESVEEILDRLTTDCPKLLTLHYFQQTARLRQWQGHQQNQF